MASLSAANKENKITINENRESSEYRTYYFMLEKWLRDSCPSLEAAVASHNKESDKSSTEDAEAMDAYNKGIRAMQNNDLATATLLFTRAVGIDPEFAFAWDNLGICYRRQGKLDEALAAYNKSLELDSNGVTPLHNIPVVYEYQKKYDEAIAAYERLLQKYPDDPEGHYGAGRIFAYYKEDYEKALHELCKAYLIYTATSSPYRVDAEKNINYVYAKMKAQGKEARFYEILKEHGLNPK
jgi:tetratricopeptide (TPR) repeat protein